ncbi:MAG: hypothetical protein NVS3B19_07800 [Ginsengibacter sp.]
MAFQTGGNEFNGSIGQYTFYKRKGKPVVRHKGVGGKEKLRKKPADSIYKRNLNEFGKASSQASLLRHSMHEIIQYAKDDTMVNRLNKLFREVIKTDVVNEFGYRTVMAGSLELLEGFEFNQECAFTNVFFGQDGVEIDRILGEATVSISGFAPIQLLRCPKGATHFKFICGASQIDFDKKEQHCLVSESNFIGINADFVGKEDLKLSLKPGSDLCIVITLGIQFFQEVNGKKMRLMDLDHNSAMIVKADKV